ncbi:MotA/TolQ/ExbB proton channel family protein [Patiriisocius sp. Uisw_017]|uniref:MotA/TolQ/ExbB proton channel family protein n=1 Tax=Patiriisocius sp. Uisw_017 TaxID=3230968 RepID=UPI0039E8B82B
MNKEFLANIVYGALIIWLLFSLYYIIRLWYRKSTKSYNEYLYNSIPSVFTTIGILGTFGGIYLGLRNFDVNDIDNSIPMLLEGMKLAFLTSIFGIILSLIFRVFGQLILRTVELKEPPKQTDELSALSEILEVLKSTKTETKTNFDKLNTSLVGETETSISTQLVKLRNQTTDNQKEQEKQNILLEKIQTSLIGNEETSLLTQLEKLRSQLTDNYKEQKEHKDILKSINENNKALGGKFDEFGEILKKNNTEALVEVMKSATETFNAQMTELIQRLVQENFAELNNSVRSLNDWQKENKEMISSLTQQFKSVSKDFEIASVSIKEITENTTKLTEDNSQLSKLIEELQKVLIDDTKFQEIIVKLESSIDTIKTNTETFDETTNKLNDWIGKEHSFKKSVDILISRLKEIEDIKDINGEFWKNTKSQMEEGVSIISNSSLELRNNLDNISEEFTGQLNQTLTSLDELIQRLIEQAKR